MNIVLHFGHVCLGLRQRHGGALDLFMGIAETEEKRSVM